MKKLLLRHIKNRTGARSAAEREAYSAKAILLVDGFTLCWMKSRWMSLQAMKSRVVSLDDVG